MAAFRARDAIQVSRLTYRQFDTYIRSGFLRPSGGGGHGRGSPRQFTWRDLLALVLLADVLAAGVHVRSVAPALALVQRGRRLPPTDQLEGVAIVTDGRAAHVVRKGEIVEMSTGTIAYLLDLGAVADRVNARLQELAAA